MPRMSEQRRLEWSFFLNHRNRISYNPLCRGCIHGCKQSFRAIDVYKRQVMDGGKCILQLRGVRPFLSDKYDITKHPKYKMLSDYDKRNAFDIEKYRSHKLVVKPTQTFDLYDMGEVEAD